MNLTLGSILHKLGLIFGLVHGNDTTTTALTTNGFEVSTTPLIIDTSSFKPLFTSEGSSVSEKFLTQTTGDLKIFSDLPESTYGSSSPPTQHQSSDSTTVTEGTTIHIIEGNTTHVEVGNTTHVTGETTAHVTNDTSSNETEGTTVTGGTSSNETEATTVTGGTSSNETEATTVTGGTSSNETEATTVTGGTSSNETEGTTAHVSGSTDNSTVSDTSYSTSNSTDFTTGTPVPPTEKPGLSKGSIAAIVVGSLLAVAIVASAIVFVIKQRNNSPEHRRLNV